MKANLALRIVALSQEDVPGVVAVEPDLSLTEDAVLAEMARPWARLWVARERGGEIVGFAIIWIVAEEVHLLHLATRRDRRRRGVALGLLSRVIQAAREVRARGIYLEVRRGNQPAISLYQKLGFEPQRVRAAYYPDGEDAVEMFVTVESEKDAISSSAKVPTGQREV